MTVRAYGWRAGGGAYLEDLSPVLWGELEGLPKSGGDGGIGGGVLGGVRDFLHLSTRNTPVLVGKGGRQSLLNRRCFPTRVNAREEERT